MGFLNLFDNDRLGQIIQNGTRLQQVLDLLPENEHIRFVNRQNPQWQTQVFKMLPNLYWKLLYLARPQDQPPPATDTTSTEDFRTESHDDEPEGPPTFPSCSIS